MKASASPHLTVVVLASLLLGCSSGGGGHKAVTFAVAAGNVDPSFESDGSVTLDFGLDDGARDVAVQSDGKIIAVGHSDETGPSAVNLDIGFAFGEPDSSYGAASGQTGTWNRVLLGETPVLDVRNESGISISVAAEFDSGARASSSGFNLGLLEDNVYVTSGATWVIELMGLGNGAYDLYLYAPTHSGVPSGDMTVNGESIGEILGSPDSILLEGTSWMRVELDVTDGRIVVEGTSATNSLSGLSGLQLVPRFKSSMSLARFNADGTLDASFSGGAVTGPRLTGAEYLEAVAIQSDGKIVVAGYTEHTGGSSVLVARFNRDGTLDKNFGSQGVTTVAALDHNRARDLVIQRDGKILVAGMFSATIVGAQDAFAILRFDPDGSLDTSFGSFGLTSYTRIRGEYGNALAVQPDGKIVVVGTAIPGANKDILVVRFHSNGDYDSDFGGVGEILIDVEDADDEAHDVLIQPDGKIVIAGYQTALRTIADPIVIRLLEDGTMDTSFGNDGIVSQTLGRDDYGRAVALANNGAILVAGYSNYSAARRTDNFAYVRFTADGVLDETFNEDGLEPGRLITEFGGVARAFGVAIQRDQKIVAVGTAVVGTATVGDFAFERIR